MADIDVKRLRAIDGVAPQHKKAGEDEFEFTEGSGGALHTKDVDVLSELESIKQQQQQILHRLDEPIDTQLTGSNVEVDDVFISETLPSGAFVYSDVIEHKSDQFSVGCTTDNLHSFSVFCNRFTTSNTSSRIERFTDAENKLIDVADDNRGSSELAKTKTKYIQFQLTNRSDAQQTYNVWLSHI